MYQEGMKSLFSYLMRLSWESRVTARCLKMAWGSREKRLLNLGDGEEERQGRRFLHSGRGLCGVKLPPILKEVAPGAHMWDTRAKTSRLPVVKRQKLESDSLLQDQNAINTMGPFTKCPLLVIEHLD